MGKLTTNRHAVQYLACGLFTTFPSFPLKNWFRESFAVVARYQGSEHTFFSPTSVQQNLMLPKKFSTVDNSL